MKKFNYISLAFLTLIFMGACEQEVMTLTQPEPNTTNIGPDPCAGGAGTASFTKFIAIGNSFVAGVQGGALFNDGQTNSLPAIINKQLACAGGTATFNQPNINATLGWNLFVTQPFLSDNTKPVLGRLRLQGTPPRPTPQAYAAGVLEAVPNPAANPGFIYTGGKATLNNFGIPAIVLGQSLITQTGAWAGAGVDPRFSPFYGRLAPPPGGTSTLIGDAAAAGGSFFLFWLGLDDFFLHAAFGGDPSLAPLTNASGGTPTDFDFQYTAAITSLLGSNAELKGVVGNFPDIFKMPHFTSVPYNAIPLDAPTAAGVTAQLANNYNAFLDGMVGVAAGFTQEEADRRKLTYVAGANKILMNDETLTDLSAYMAGPYAGLAPYARARQTTSTDIIPLSTGSILGTNGTFGVLGVSEPVSDRYVLIPSEIQAINNARTAYNTIVAGIVAANTTKLALADVDAALNALITAQAGVSNGVTITPNINPPTGIYSEDGVHPNTRGYAFLANVFIDAINAKFGSTIPRANLAKYPATGLPLP
ncbi:MAG: hypothetical protein KF803_08940 [Cyclobacteriaceae bacterium]|nr:hypothetical protein [Cyclobacteriaceae bacterium]